jgi:hypothetical protein
VVGTPPVTVTVAVTETVAVVVVVVLEVVVVVLVVVVVVVVVEPWVGGLGHWRWLGKWVKTPQIFFGPRQSAMSAKGSEYMQNDPTYSSEARQVGVVLRVLAVVPPRGCTMLPRMLGGAVVTLLAKVIANGLVGLSVFIAHGEGRRDKGRSRKSERS